MESECAIEIITYASRHMIEYEGISYRLTDRLSSVVVLCQKAQMQVGYGSGNFRKIKIRLSRFR